MNEEESVTVRPPGSHKPLILKASYYTEGDQDWDYRECAYPLLRQFGLFDSLKK